MRGLKNVYWVLVKELHSFFGANLPPLSLGLVALLCGLIGVLVSLSRGATYEAITASIFYFFYLVTMVASVLFSMSAFVNEKRQGTMELLYTLPVSDLELVVGKYLMALTIMIPLTALITLVYVVIIAGSPLYVGLSGWVGLSLLSIYAISVGIFASSLTSSHLVSMLVSIVLLVLVDIGGFLGGLLPEPARGIITYFHSIHHYTPFTHGVIALRSVVFYLSSGALFLFLSVKVLESRRWRGQMGG